MDYKIGYAASVGEKSIIDSMKFAMENGFNAVEINMNMKCFFPENYSTEFIEEIKNYKIENNIELTMHAPEDISLLQLHDNVRIAGVQRLKEIIDFGKEILASRITIHIGGTPYFTLVDEKSYLQDIFYEEYKVILKDVLIELIDYCKDKIKLCIENSGRFSVKLIQEVLNEILKEKNIFLTWDIGHSHSNLYDEIKFFENNIEKIKTCHLHDVNDKSDHQIISTGNVKILEHINKIRHEDIVYIIEVRPRNNAIKSLENLKCLLKIQKNGID